MHPEFKVFYRRPTETGFEFVATELVESNLDGIVVRFADLLLREDEEIELFHEDGDEFRRQTWRVERSHPSMQAVYAWLQPVSESLPGSLRESSRVPTAFEGIHVEFGSETECVALDISDDGLAILAKESALLGSTHAITLSFRQMKLTGHVKLCSMTGGPPGQSRYGLQCQPDEEGCNLRRMLPMLATALQVQRLESISWSEDPEMAR